MAAKDEIIALFRTNVKGNKPDTAGSNSRHDGKEGHWLERQFGIAANANNDADIMGYELKNTTKSKTTFGDWSANEYIYNSGAYSDVFTGSTSTARRDRFMDIFGQANEKKKGRCSWSGKPCPKIDEYNSFGQRMIITDNKDVVAEYSYSKDTRANKEQIVPEPLRVENLVLAIWYRESLPEGISGECLKTRVERKFNDKGWFTCKKDDAKSYCTICFGKPMSFDEWINLVKSGIVFLDSGMHQGNSRNYSNWRASNNYWDSLIEETFE